MMAAAVHYQRAPGGPTLQASAARQSEFGDGCLCGSKYDDPSKGRDKLSGLRHGLGLKDIR